VQDIEEEALADMGERIHELASTAVEPADQAYFLNQLQRLHWGAGNHEEAERFVRQAIELNPSTAYWYNLSLICEHRGILEEAEEAIDQMMADSDFREDSDHVSQAIDILYKRERIAEAKELFSELKVLDPGKARLKALLDREMVSRLEA
jgi:tetratricopeptide (TPR) repeat protein